MGCEVLTDKNGKAIGFACSRGSSRPKCKCGRPSEYLCDFPLRGRKQGQTCDAPLCDSCAKLIKKTATGSVHYCPAHQRLSEK